MQFSDKLLTDNLCWLSKWLLGGTWYQLLGLSMN